MMTDILHVPSLQEKTVRKSLLTYTCPQQVNKGSVKTTNSGLKIGKLPGCSGDLKLNRPTKS